MSNLEARIAEVLGAHLKRNIKSCDCGWADIGKRHYEHVAAMLAPVVADVWDEGSESVTLATNAYGGWMEYIGNPYRTDNLEKP